MLAPVLKALGTQRQGNTETTQIVERVPWKKHLQGFLPTLFRGFLITHRWTSSSSDRMKSLDSAGFSPGPRAMRHNNLILLGL
ncbi:uncharacterized protein LOC125754439 isoform X10 [Canis lupus dingo]|uniref:uncharacterized protein LOC125754439 isoform X10 n=1 Tax=Canis lupus dingo TaxID=286419 RepID=UPI0020C2FC49|nr:uncharacterized protein LOC125754439 isoform X10 [Canis lupus dingo]